jgi:hypothetical protein
MECEGVTVSQNPTDRKLNHAQGATPPTESPDSGDPPPSLPSRYPPVPTTPTIAYRHGSMPEREASGIDPLNLDAPWAEGPW